MKVGITEKKFSERIEQYHTYYPLGVYMCAFLKAPTIGRKKGQPLRTYLESIETHLFETIREAGGDYVWSTTRIRKEGRTEWVYAGQQHIATAFHSAREKFGGQLELFDLQSIGAEADRMEKMNHTDATIIYPLAPDTNKAEKAKLAKIDKGKK